MLSVHPLVSSFVRSFVRSSRYARLARFISSRGSGGRDREREREGGWEGGRERARERRRPHRRERIKARGERGSLLVASRSAIQRRLTASDCPTTTRHCEKKPARGTPRVFLAVRSRFYIFFSSADVYVRTLHHAASRCCAHDVARCLVFAICSSFRFFPWRLHRARRSN